jgi:DNA recombination protein RmuC
MSKEATNLTKALKGDNKVLGNWGEFILESILEKSGLEKGREFTIQESIRGEDGVLLRPDIIVKLPENKSMIIDSKASLSAYDLYCSTEDDIKREQYLGEHINSIKNHIKKLSPKSYQNLYGLESLDFVLMFIPIEPAFALAVQMDNNIFNEAFERNIVLVSPSTLLATLRTIASIWKQEKQNRNAMEIAKQCGELYDKFTGFVEDLVAIGSNIKSTQENYDKAMNKLVEGRGNLVRRVENIKQLGAKSTKSLPGAILDRADDEPAKEESSNNL